MARYGNVFGGNQRGRKPRRNSRSDNEVADFVERFRESTQTLGATAGIVGAVTSSGLAADAVNNDVADAKGIGEGWKNSAQIEQRNEQARGQRRETTYKGRQRDGSSQND